MEFQNDLQVLHVVNSPINFKGSYRLKNFGDLITDIDLSHHVMAEKTLITALQTWTKRSKGNFIFLNLSCGMYKPFRPPWKVDKDGDCAYDPEKARTWLENIKPLIDGKTYNSLQEKLFSSRISLKNLIETKQITRSYSEILWSLEDLERGEKKFMGDVYTIPELMREGYYPIARFIYNYHGEYCAVDFTMSDQRFKTEMSPLHDYYLQDYYKIFKSYKWYIEYRYKQEFAVAMRNIQAYTGLLSRMKLLDTIVKNKLSLDTTKLSRDIQGRSEQLKVTQASLPGIIATEAKKYIEVFRHKVQPKYADMIEKYNLRAVEASMGITQEELAERLKLSRNCPFFTLSLSVFDKVFDLAKRALIIPSDLLRCISAVGEKKGVSPEKVAGELALNDSLRLVKGMHDVSMYRGQEMIFRESLLALDKLKIQVITGKNMSVKPNQTKPKPGLYMNPTNAVITMTFGEVAENHAGMQKLGSLAKEGFSIQDLVKAKTAFESLGAKCELVYLECPMECKNCEAAVLVVRQGVKLFVDPLQLWKELSELDTDKMAKMRGRIVNKIARHNLCIDEFDQEPEYETGKGRVVSWGRVPLLETIRESLPNFAGEKARDLKAEGNYYYDLSICGIGYHGDSERRKVIAVRLGASMPIFYRWYYKSERIGEPIKIELHDSDMYIMSEKAVGTDWKLKNTPTLRHATGACKYTD